MKREDAKAFAEFLLDEATKYRVQIATGEIDLWFETFERTTLGDFKAAWASHKRDERLGTMFPKIPWMQRALRTTSGEAQQRDWRCSEEVGGQRCGYPGAINGGYGWQCRAHYRLKGSSGYTEAASLQIIEASRDYAPPKSPMESMERGAAQRAADAERWRARNADAYANLRPVDGAARVGLFATRVLPAATKPDEPGRAEADETIAQADAARLDEINRQLAEASEEP